MSRRSPWNAPGSLHRRMLFGWAAASAVLLLAAGWILYQETRLRERIVEATEGFVEEERISERISRLVIGEFLAVSTADATAPAGGSVEEELYESIQSLLFRPLSAEERLQLERIKEQHQRLEVAAAGVRRLFRDGSERDVEAARREMTEHATELLSALGEFMAMRSRSMEEVQSRQLDQFRILSGSLLALVVLLVVVSLLAARFLHRRIRMPLAALANAARRIEEGELDVRVPPQRDAEFELLGASFNRMTDSLARTRTALQDRNEEIETALSRLEEAQKGLIQAEKLSAMGRMTAELAHQINNPLASVLGYASLLAQTVEEAPEAAVDETFEEYLEALQVEARRARTLVLSFLTFSRKAGEEARPVDLAEMLDVVVELRRFAFREAGLELRVDVPDRCLVVADPQRLQEVLLNLVNNALDALREAGSEGGRLVVGCTRDGDHVDVVFEDDGPGFDRPEWALEPFYTTKPPGDGTGLGLTIAHNFATALGGAVHVENRQQGGARVTLRLPGTVPGREPSQPEPPPEEHGQGPVQAADGGSTRIRQGGHASVAAGDRSTKALVLVVDDEPHLRRVQERVLGGLDVRVRTAASGAEARRILEVEEVRVVVSDVRMPGMDGLELFEWVKKERPVLAERFLFVTGDIHGAEVRKLARLHPGMFLQKPFEVEEYRKRVGRLL